VKNASVFKKRIPVFRQNLLKTPELSWNEIKTSSYIKKVLGEPLWQEKTAFAYAAGHGTPIFFRAELDAITTSEGVKHVCGHATHSAALMGTYLYFKENPPRDKTIYFIFQPSEEGYPSGAAFIAQHFDKLKTCKAGFTVHVWPDLHQGELYDVKMAASDYFEIIVKGKGTHIINKNVVKEKDPIAVAGNIAHQINQTKHKNFIVYIGTITGGETPNALAAQVRMTGDIRAIDEIGRLDAYQFLRKVLDRVGETATGVEITTDYFMGYPMTESNNEIKKQIKHILPINEQIESFGTDDFSLYPVPSMTLYIGTGRAEELHRVDFVVPVEIAVKIYEYWIKIGKQFHL